MSEYVAKCSRCGILARGGLEECGDTIEDHDRFHDDLDHLIAAGAIEQVRREHEPTETGANYPWRYRVARWAHHLAAEQVAHRDAPMPCGHAGIRNLRDGAYTCTLDRCELTYERAEVNV